jgi:peptidoglycan glycosyltransferase
VTLNRQIRRLGLVLIVLFVALFAQLNYLQVVQADKLRDDPRNTRKAVRDFSRPRGAIVSAEGAVLARSVPVEGRFKRLRVYPDETATLFAHVTGYFSFTFGNDGVERTYNDELAGRTDLFQLDRLDDLLLDHRRTANVVLTVRRSVQQVAADALGARRGAVVALDPRSGAVLALWSFPSYNPNLLSVHDQKSVQAAWTNLGDDVRRPLLPRAYRDRYFPGSTFKVVTAAGALVNGVAGPDRPRYPTRSALDLPRTPRDLHNFGGGSCGGNLRQAMRVSCNTVFAQIGLQLGGPRLAAISDAFGFNHRPPVDLPAAATSRFPSPRSFVRDEPALAQSAIGQRDVSATPMQMALVASAVANNGVAMQPHVLSEVRDSDGQVLRKAEGRPWVTAVPPPVAASLRDLMVGVVNGGTASRIAIPGVQVAAKTGTAQTGTNSSHAWIVGFAPANEPRVAVAVILEGQPGVTETTGGREAAPVARAVLQAALAGP